MKKYIFAYHGGDVPSTDEERNMVMAKWNKWIQDLGETMENPGNPLGMSKTVSAFEVRDDGGPDPLMGYSIVKANSIDEAIEIAKGCPHIDDHGTIEVAELLDM